ncbi:MAG: FkbM family methyltransferase [Dehalococcoidia bacterium]
MNIWGRVLTHRLASPVKRAGVFLASSTNMTAWVRLHTGQSLKVDLSSSVGRSIWLRGVYEAEVEACIRRTLKPGDAFIDVGAHVGYFSIIAAGIVGETGEVHCFEPNGKVLELLKASIVRNGLRRVYAHPWALWSRSEMLALAVQKDSGFSYVLPVELNGARSLLEIEKTTTLDEYVSSFVERPVRLVKVDVEGAEHHVLSGMERLMRTQSPQLIIEAQDWSLSRYGHGLDDLFGLLQERDYQCSLLNGQSVRDAQEARQRLEKSWVKNLVFERVRKQ